MESTPLGDPVAATAPDVGAVLVIDDDPAYARLAQLILEESLPDGYAVLRASSLREAIALTTARPVRCVVLDLSVVDEDDGFAAIKMLRTGGVRAPVIVLSGRTDVGLAEVAAGRGAAGYVVKGDEHDGALGRAVAAHLV